MNTSQGPTREMHPQPYGHPVISTPGGFDIAPEIMKLGSMRHRFLAVLGYKGIPALNAPIVGLGLEAAEGQNAEAQRLFAGLSFYVACSDQQCWPSPSGRARRLFRILGL